VPATTKFNDLINLLKDSNAKPYVLCDENSYTYCYPQFCEILGFQIHPIIIKVDESLKNIQSCESIWHSLMEDRAGKEAILINLGGGVISDIGGFAAATYKRGIKYVNVPTTLLAMIDAATGGKTGVNFAHFKNMIGLIQQPELVIIHAPFLKTLPLQHLKNGFAEMLKHALLNSHEHLSEILNVTDFLTPLDENSILKSMAIKEHIVTLDPNENGFRKTLNLGHTVGHAIEYAALEHNYEMLHGEAVALGLIAALKLSVNKLNFNESKAETIIQFIRNIYPTPLWVKHHHETIINAIWQDKKNSHQQIKMVLLKDVGNAVYDIVCFQEEIAQVLNEI
jgi:3-dehydroquinate synthase